MLPNGNVLALLADRIPLGYAGGVWRTYVPLSQAVILTDEEVYRALHHRSEGDVRLGTVENILAERAKSIGARISKWNPKIIGDQYLGTCVVLIPTAECNLRCRYCSTAAGSSLESSTIRMDKNIANVAVRTACRNAAIHAALGRPAAADIRFLGGGEPTFDWHLFSMIVESAHACALEYSVPLKLSLVTNGVFSEDHAEWIGERFDFVHVSVDGPPDIQDAQRPLPGNTGSSDVVFRALEVLCSSRAKTTVRATMTHLCVGRGKGIVTYLFKRFPELQFIHFEPAIGSPIGRNLIDPIESAEFVETFKEAVQAAEDLGRDGRVISTLMRTRLVTSYCRSTQGRACHIAPSGAVTSCNEVFDLNDPRWSEFCLGLVDVDGRKLKLDPGSVHKSITESGRVNSFRPECVGCIARWQCRGGCRARYLDHQSDWPAIWCSMVQPLTKWILERLVERAKSDGRLLDDGSNAEDGRDKGVFGAVAIPNVPNIDINEPLLHSQFCGD